MVEVCSKSISELAQHWPTCRIGIFQNMSSDLKYSCGRSSMLDSRFENFVQEFILQYRKDLLRKIS